MDEVIKKFNYYLDNYYKQILKQIELNNIFSSFLATMDLNLLYPCLFDKSNFDEDFINVLSSLKKLSESDHFDYYLYDDLINQLISFEYFKDLNIKLKYLNEQKENYELKLFDYSFLTKFMLDRNFSISEINYVLSNYKPNKKVVLDEKLKKDENFKKQIINSKIYIECSNFLSSNEIIIKKLGTNIESFNLFTYACNLITNESYEYSEPIYTIHYLNILNKKKIIDEMIEKKLDINEKNEVFNLLFEMKDILEKVNKLNINKNNENISKKSIIFIDDNIQIPNEILKNLSLGIFDYKIGKHPIKLINIIDYIVRVNSNNNYAVSFIENEDSVIILTYDKKDKIIEKTEEFVKLYSDKINNILGRENYGR
ncbi:MAG: hypothetical protein ACI4XR_03395 [Bacilli bacterium]